MENEWAAHLEAGDKVFVHIETDGAQRPNAYMGYVIYESPDGTRDYDTFHMVNAEIENQISIAGKVKVVPVATADNVGIGFVALS